MHVVSCMWSLKEKTSTFKGLLAELHLTGLPGCVFLCCMSSDDIMSQDASLPPLKSPSISSDEEEGERKEKPYLGIISSDITHHKLGDVTSLCVPSCV